MARGQPPTLAEERALREKGHWSIAGVDEVGRGPLAGPLVVGAVVLPEEPEGLSSLRESKQLRPTQREAMFSAIQGTALGWGVGIVPPQVIDSSGMTAATRLGVEKALAALPRRPDFALIDGLRLPGLAFPHRTLVFGDRRCLSIAAASIIAKVTRDRLMVEMDALYPGYGFASHKGYGTKAHLEALERLGPCPIHRRSFSPLRTPDGGK